MEKRTTKLRSLRESRLRQLMRGSHFLYMTLNDLDELCLHLLWRHWHRKQLYFTQTDRRQIYRLLPIPVTPIFTETVRMPREQKRFNGIIYNSRTEYMVLMNAIFDLIFPNPSTAELVTVTPLIEENISPNKPQRLGFDCRNSNFLNPIENEPASLDIRNPEVRHLNVLRVTLFLTVLRYTACDRCNLPKTSPSPPCGEMRKLTVIDVRLPDFDRKKFYITQASTSTLPCNPVVEDFRIRQGGTRRRFASLNVGKLFVQLRDNSALFRERWNRNFQACQVRSRNSTLPNCTRHVSLSDTSHVSLKKIMRQILRKNTPGTAKHVKLGASQRSTTNQTLRFSDLPVLHARRNLGKENIVFLEPG